MPTEAEILNALFAAASGLSDKPRWERFLELLGAGTHAGTVTLQLQQQGRPTQDWHWIKADGPPPLRIEDWQRMRSHRVYSQDDLAGLASISSPLRAIKYPFGSSKNDSALLTLQRQGADFRAIDGVHLSSLVPYLPPALDTWEALNNERLRTQLSQNVMRNIGAGWVLFSSHGVLIDMDSELRTPLEQIGGIRFAQDGRPSFRDEATAQALRQALSNAQRPPAPSLTAGGWSPPSAVPRPTPVPLRLSNTPLMEMIITEEDDFHSTPHLIGRVRYARTATDLPLLHVARHFRLSPSEARLACLLCDGHTLAEAAGQLGWTIETTRSTSKQLFARLEVRGQSGVIRLMQSGALWLSSSQHPNAGGTTR